MMNPAALQLAAELGGTLLSGLGGGLLLVERSQGHGLAQVAVLGRGAADLLAPLEAAERLQAGGLQLNLLALLPLPGCDLTASLDLHRRRLGALVAALDAGLPWLNGKPMLARRLPGRIRRATPVPLAKAPMGPQDGLPAPRVARGPGSRGTRRLRDGALARRAPARWGGAAGRAPGAPLRHAPG